MNTYNISTHTLTWSVTWCMRLGYFKKDFNLHAHVERDLWNISFHPCKFHFNSHAHVERDPRVLDDFEVELNFNSHAHVERDQPFTIHLPWWEISTHTLTWSVTIVETSAFINPKISTHTLTWSVTNHDRVHDRQNQISTHTLTWSVTLDVVYIWCLLNVMRTYFFI